MNEKDKDSIYPSEKVVLEELRLKRAFQLKTIEDLDKKIATVFGINGVVFSVLLTGIGIRSESILYPPQSLILLVFVLVAVLFLSFFFSVLAFLPRYYRFDPSADTLVGDYLNRLPQTPEVESKTGSVAQICADMEDAYKENKRILDKKSLFMKVSLILILVGFLIAAVVLVLIF